MKNWAFIHQSAFCAIMWNDAIEKGLHPFSTWNDIKIYLTLMIQKSIFILYGTVEKLQLSFNLLSILW
jgi:hypothetical protein